jgi:HEAT repeat protein
VSARFAAIFLACLAFAPGAFAASPPASSPALWGDLLPPDASAILGELATGDDEARWRAEVRLVELGEAALPALLQLAGSDDPRVRDAVASVLLGMG